jgi:methionine-rich copper-binding protein CopC
MLLVACLLGQASPQAILAVDSNVGYADFSFGSAPGADPTGEKPQSKLWFNDGRWWGSLFNRIAGTYHIYWLDVAAQAWVDSNVELDDRPDTRADCMWDAAVGKLYIASGGASKDARLYRYTYDAANKSYSRDTGFPVTIRSGGAETIVLDKDSTGRLWVTYTKSSQVYVNYSNGSDTTWVGPTALNVSGTKSAVSADDISSLIAVNNRVIVLWSNQSDKTFYYAAHSDADPVTSWTGGVAGRDPNGAALADDHINIKSLQSDAAGNIFAVVKTSINSASSSSPQIILLVAKRQTSGNGYTWQPPAMVSSGAENQTRAILLIDTDQRNLHVFTADESGGSIYHKQASIDNIQFPAGFGERFIGHSMYPNINNPSSTKQTVNSSTGLVVIASDDTQDWYLHNMLELGGPPPDITPPLVTDKIPAAGAANIAVVTHVSATFSEPVSGVNGSSFTLTPAGGAAVAASVSYDSATRTATLTPSAALSYSTTYTAQLSNAIADTAGNPLAAVSWSFTTAAPPADTTPPAVIARSPLSGATGVEQAANITATFSEDVVPASVNATSVTLTGASAVAASVSYNPANRTVTLNPNADLSPSSTYTVHLTNAITDLSGNPLAPLSWSFTTAAPPPDTAPPTVVSVGPADSATNVSTTTAISAVFSEPLDSTTLTGASFSLTNASGEVAATITYDSATRTATLQPQQPLAAGTVYSARIIGVKDMAGNELADAVSWSFTTAAAQAPQYRLLLPAILR